MQYFINESIDLINEIVYNIYNEGKQNQIKHNGVRTMKYNLSTIMKTANTYAKTMTRSLALRKAWAEAKVAAVKNVWNTAKNECSAIWMPIACKISLDCPHILWPLARRTLTPAHVPDIPGIALRLSPRSQRLALRCPSLQPPK